MSQKLVQLDLIGYQGERSPGYPLLISLAGNSLLITTILQSIIGIATLVFVYKTLLITNVNRKLSLTITLVAAAYLSPIFFELAILSETLTLFFVTLILYVFLNIYRKIQNNWSSYLSLSLLCGLLVLIKPFYIFLPFILYIILCVSSSKSIVSKYIIVLLFPIIAYTAWSGINKINTGYFVPTTYYGFNMAQNCVSFAENTSDQYKEIGKTYAHYRDVNLSQNRYTAMSIWEAYPQLKNETGLSLPDLSKKLYDYSIATIRLNPIAYLKQVGISWIDFWKTPLYCDYDKFPSPGSAVFINYCWKAEWVLMQLLKLTFATLIPYNIAFSIKRKRLSNQAIISIIVLTTSILQAFATYGTNARFSFPFELLMLCSLVFNLQHIIQRRSKKVEN